MAEEESNIIGLQPLTYIYEMVDGSTLSLYFNKRKCFGFGLNIDGLTIFGKPLTELQIKRRFEA